MPCRNFNQKDSESRPSCPHGTVRQILYHDLPAPGTARKILYYDSPAPGTARQILYHDPPAPGTARKILYHDPPTPLALLERLCESRPSCHWHCQTDSESRPARPHGTASFFITTLPPLALLERFLITTLPTLALLASDSRPSRL